MIKERRGFWERPLINAIIGGLIVTIIGGIILASLTMPFKIFSNRIDEKTKDIVNTPEELRKLRQEVESYNEKFNIEIKSRLEVIRGDIKEDRKNISRIDNKVNEHDDVINRLDKTSIKLEIIAENLIKQNENLTKQINRLRDILK